MRTVGKVERTLLKKTIEADQDENLSYEKEEEQRSGSSDEWTVLDRTIGTIFGWNIENNTVATIDRW